MVENDYIVRREALSHAYLQSVVSYAGGSLSQRDKIADNMGYDALVTFQGKWTESSMLYQVDIDIQLKATSNNYRLCDDYISYEINREHYEKYRNNAMIPRKHSLILLMILPPEEEFEEWLRFSEEELRFRKCMYWVSLRDAPVIGNQQKFTIHFPRKNLFTSDSLLNDIVKPLSEGKDLTYES